MGTLGDVVFGIGGDATYEKMTATDTGGWVFVDRPGQAALTQYVGAPTQTRQITGTVYGDKGKALLDKLRMMNSSKAPQVYIDGAGNVVGQFVITTLNESQSRVISTGRALKTSFTIALGVYSE